jgi:hypothetical protein
MSRPLRPIETFLKYIECIEKKAEGERGRREVYVIAIFLFIVISICCTIFAVNWLKHSSDDTDVNKLRGLADVVVALTAVGAFVGAVVHVYEIQKDSKRKTDISEATFLMELDRRSVTPDMLEAQRSLTEIWDKAKPPSDNLKSDELCTYRYDYKKGSICDYINKQYNNKSLGELFVINEEFKNYSLKQWEKHVIDDNMIIFSDSQFDKSANIAKELATIREANTDLYHSLLRNCEFFETVGMAVSNGHVKIGDILARFEVGIIRVYIAFALEILALQNDPRYLATSKQLFKDVLFLGKKALEATKLEATNRPAPPANPAGSAT